MYDFNENYWLVEVEHMKNYEESELLDTLLSYDKPIPEMFYSLFNKYRNYWDVPKWVVKKVLEKHEEHLTEHIRYEAFRHKGESFQECDDRLKEQFVKETGSPLFVYKSVDPKGYIDEVYMNLIADELVQLDDFVPPEFIPLFSWEKRRKWLEDNDKQEIIRQQSLYGSRWKVRYGDERSLFEMETIKEFLEKYPKYSKLVYADFIRL
jgi:hypothetical protein